MRGLVGAGLTGNIESSDDGSAIVATSIIGHRFNGLWYLRKPFMCSVPNIVGGSVPAGNACGGHIFDTAYVRSRTDGGLPVTQVVPRLFGLWAVRRIVHWPRPGPSLFAWPGAFLRVRRIVGDVWIPILPDGAFPMARKKPVKKKASPRSVRPPSAKPAGRAHPRLIHGFLIRLATKATIPAEDARPALTAGASVKTPAQRLSDTKPEGPAGGETFH